MEARQVDPTVLIETEFSLDEALKAFERAAETGALKVLIRAS
jgi:threonine dehydrogenase-like Zn-dependent dehydrogenase